MYRAYAYIQIDVLVKNLVRCRRITVQVYIRGGTVFLNTFHFTEIIKQVGGDNQYKDLF